MMEIKQYKDYEGNKVKVGDEIEKIEPWDESLSRPLGKVTSLRKEGFYVWLRTDKYPKHDIWGKFTRKVGASK